MTSDPTEVAEMLRSMTSELLACARSGDWERAVILENERRPLLKTLFGCSTAPDVEWKPLLEEVLAVDQEVIVLAKERHTALAGQIRQMGLGRSAVRAYDNHSR